MTSPPEARSRDAVAFADGARWTHAELDRRVALAAAGLRALGRERLAARLHRPIDTVVLALAALRGGVTLALVPRRWPSALAAAALARCGVDTLVADTAAPVGGLRIETLDRVAAASAPGPNGEAGAVAVFTSGSTGPPKAAVLSAAALAASADGVNAHLGFDGSGRWLLDLPPAHVAGLGIAVRALRAGGTMLIPGAAALAEALAALRPTHLSLVSTQLRRLLDADADTSGVRAVLLGGSAIPAELLDRARAAGLPVSTSYGLTEMSSTVTATAPEAPPAALGTSGAPLPGRELAILGGEIHVRGAGRFAGYLTPDGLDRPFGADGWFATGDLGRLDPAGRLVVEGRRGLRFVSGGENVQPEAIERALLAVEGVAEAVVVPVPDAEFGQRPAAWVRRAGATDAELEAAVREALPGYCVPAAFLDWDGAAGMKPDRQALAAAAARRL